MIRRDKYISRRIEASEYGVIEADTWCVTSPFHVLQNADAALPLTFLGTHTDYLVIGLLFQVQCSVLHQLRFDEIVRPQCVVKLFTLEAHSNESGKRDCVGSKLEILHPTQKR